MSPWGIVAETLGEIWDAVALAGASSMTLMETARFTRIASTPPMCAAMPPSLASMILTKRIGAWPARSTDAVPQNVPSASKGPTEEALTRTW